MTPHHVRASGTAVTSSEQCSSEQCSPRFLALKLYSFGAKRGFTAVLGRTAPQNLGGCAIFCRGDVGGRSQPVNQPISRPGAPPVKVGAPAGPDGNLRPGDSPGGYAVSIAEAVAPFAAGVLPREDLPRALRAPDRRVRAVLPPRCTRPEGAAR